MVSDYKGPVWDMGISSVAHSHYNSRITHSKRADISQNDAKMDHDE